MPEYVDKVSYWQGKVSVARRWVLPDGRVRRGAVSSEESPRPELKAALQGLAPFVWEFLELREDVAGRLARSARPTGEAAEEVLDGAERVWHVTKVRLVWDKDTGRLTGAGVVMWRASEVAVGGVEVGVCRTEWGGEGLEALEGVVEEGRRYAEGARAQMEFEDHG